MKKLFKYLISIGLILLATTVARAQISSNTLIDLDDPAIYSFGHFSNWDNANPSPSGIITIYGDVTITGSNINTGYRVYIEQGSIVNITLDNAEIVDLTSFGVCAFDMGGTSGLSSEVNLTLIGNNTLTSGNGYAGLQVSQSSILTIGGSGTLTATGGDDAAGIGGGNIGSPGVNIGGTITINSGTVYAIADNYGAGIGGGRNGAGGVITINGGTVTGENQASGDGGSGIGPGYNGVNGIITINNGTVNAISSSLAAGISGDITIYDGTLDATHNGSGGSAIDYLITVGGGEVTGTSENGSGISAQITLNDGMITAISKSGLGGAISSTTIGLPTYYLYWLNASAPVIPATFASVPPGPTFPISYYANQYIRIRSGVLSTTTLTSNLNPSVLGQSVTFTAAVTAPNVGPSLDGSMQFYVDGVPEGSAVMINPSGIATMTISTLSPGTHSITAVYSGDGTYTPSTSNTLTQTVNSVSLITTSTQLTSDLNPSDFGESVTFTATVSPTSATGTVQFYVDGVPEGSPVLLNAYGEAAMTISTLTVGNSTITAVYDGSITHASSSDNLVQTVNWAPTPVEATNITAAKVYDGINTFTADQIDLTAAVLTGVLSSDDVVLSKTGARGVFGPDAGTGTLVFTTPLTLTGADAAKYILIPPTVTATITPKAITVKATGGSSNYGDSPENPGVSATGLAAGQTASVLTELTNSFAITATTPIGTYVLTVEGDLTNPNYTLAAIDTGTWIVNKRPLTVAAVSQTIGDNQTPALRYEIREGSLLIGDQLTGELSCPPPYTIGTHPITQGTLSAPDYYALTFIPGTLTVLSADVSVEEIVVDGLYPVRNGNNYTVLSPCGANSANINVSAGQYATVRVNGQQQNSTTVHLPKYGDNVFDIVITSQSGASAAYTLTVHRSVPVPIAFFDRFNDVLTVPAHVEGIDGAITSVEWYHNGNRLDRDSGKGYLEMKEVGIYYALLNSSIRTCEVVKLATLSAAVMTVYPNPAGANQEITVQINRPAGMLQGARLQLHNINGQLLKTVPVTGNSMTVETPGYSGAVIVKLISDSGNEEVKLIIK